MELTKESSQNWPAANVMEFSQQTPNSSTSVFRLVLTIQSRQQIESTHTGHGVLLNPFLPRVPNDARLADQPFLVFDFPALWRSCLSATVPESQKLKMVGLPTWRLIPELV